MIGTGDLGAAKDTLNINDAAANGTMTNRGTEALKVFSTSTDTAALVALAPACIGVAVWSVCRYLRCELFRSLCMPGPLRVACVLALSLWLACNYSSCRRVGAVAARHRGDACADRARREH